MTEQTPAQPLQPTYQYPPSRPTNGLAVASMVLGILWIYWIGSILAVIFGHVALRSIKRTGHGGKGMAIAGLVLGYVGVATLVIVGIAAVVSANSIDTDTSDFDFTPTETRLDQLHNECASGDMASCDALFVESPYGSAEENFGDTCGGRNLAGTVWCDD